MMPQDNDHASIALELREAADSLRTRLKLLGEAGLTIVPSFGGSAGAAISCPEVPVAFECGPDGMAAFSPCPLHASWEGALFGCWAIELNDGGGDGAAIIWGAPVSVNDNSLSSMPFRPEAMEQFLRMLEWLAGELNAATPGAFRLFASGKCLESGRTDLSEAARASASLLENWLSGVRPRAVLLMGNSAVKAFSQRDETPGEPFEKSGLVFISTYSPDEMLKSRARKKEAHGHLNGFIKALRP